MEKQTETDDDLYSAKGKLESAVSQYGDAPCEVVFSKYEAFSLALILEGMDRLCPEVGAGYNMRVRLLDVSDDKLPVQFGESEARKLLDQVEHFLELTEDCE